MYAVFKSLYFVHAPGSPNPDTVRIVLSLLQQELSGIVFCYSRTTVKNLLKLLAKEAENWGNAGLARRVS
ncbi:MAG: hypothetical protein EWV82_08100 [Microcystis aeruginosa Ma_AC_P_19900807_S299]|nr:MAG: hypothetical protein EWV82_08100 [Microcystis aeruginosa Ma_AC_P_19900807_S299]